MREIAKLLLACLLMGVSVLGAIEYDIKDIGTLQTHKSVSIDMNNEGQILGWYQIDSNQVAKRVSGQWNTRSQEIPEWKHFFIRERDGSFQEIPSQCEWKYLTSSGKVYGFTDGGPAYSWDKCNGVVGLGTLPKGSVVKVNDLGQILLSLSR